MGLKSWAAQGRMAGAQGAQGWGKRWAREAVQEQIQEAFNAMVKRPCPLLSSVVCWDQCPQKKSSAVRVLLRTSEDRQLPHMLEHEANGFSPRFIPQKRRGCLIVEST